MIFNEGKTVYSLNERFFFHNHFTYVYFKKDSHALRANGVSMTLLLHTLIVRSFLLMVSTIDL